MSDAQAADALSSSRQIVPPNPGPIRACFFFFVYLVVFFYGFMSVVYPDTINQMFDAITYSKGGVVLRMLQSYADYLHQSTSTDSYFFQRIATFLKEKSFSVATTADLVAAIDASGQAGFPVKSSSVCCF